MLDKSNLPKFDPETYHKIALNDLVVYSIHFFQHDGAEISSEDLISACFLLFPKRFSLRNYPHWPDSAVVSRRWIECRVRGYIIGSAPEGFKLTAKGIKYGERVAKKLGVENPKPVQITKKYSPKKVFARRAIQTKKPAAVTPEKIESSPPAKKAVSAQSEKIRLPVRTKGKTQLTKPNKVRPAVQLVLSRPKQTVRTHPTPALIPKEVKARAGKFVRVMETSDAYLHYKKMGKSSKISEFDFRSLLLCTMESSRETLAKNLELYKGYADMHQRRDLLIFLGHCEKRFSYLLVPPQKKTIKPIRKSKR